MITNISDRLHVELETNGFLRLDKDNGYKIYQTSGKNKISEILLRYGFKIVYGNVALKKILEKFDNKKEQEFIFWKNDDMDVVFLFKAELLKGFIINMDKYKDFIRENNIRIVDN